jgi:type IV fimbrial biogenesis protein FimT
MRLKGFSLIEWLVSFSIALIVLMAAIPSQTTFLTQAASKTAASQLLQAIYLARHAAMSRGETVILCHSQDQKTCAGTWAQGYIVIASQKVIYAFRDISDHAALYWRGFPKYQTALEFLPSGAARTENGTFWYCPQGMKKPAWAIIVNQAGRARQVGPDQNGEIYDGRGRFLGC